MLGHSDGGKEEGFIGAQWRIWRAQEDLVSVCQRHGIGFAARIIQAWDARRGFALGEQAGQSLQSRAAAAMAGEQAAKAHGANALGLCDAPEGEAFGGAEGGCWHRRNPMP